MAEQVLIYGDSVRFPEMRHEVPLAVPDPFFYAERGGERHVVSHTMELARMGALGHELHGLEEFGYDDLVRSGASLDEFRNELALRICRGLGIDDARVPFWFPLQLADHLRANGIALQADREYFADRRRVKNEAELAGIRRAQAAAEAGMAAARDLLGKAEPSDGRVLVDGEPLTVEQLKRAIEEEFLAHGTAADEFIVSHGPQTAIGHEMGSGAIAPNEPIVIDLWPRDRESACYADMTRTFVVGEPPEELVRWHALVHESLERSLGAIKAGVAGRDVYDVSCDVFEREGFPTGRTKEPGEPLEDGFFHGLGHGVGLQVHEEPNLGLIGQKELVAGDVVTVEPGLYRQGFGGCRLEDLVVVTDDGIENLTDFPYDLTP